MQENIDAPTIKKDKKTIYSDLDISIMIIKMLHVNYQEGIKFDTDVKDIFRLIKAKTDNHVPDIQIWGVLIELTNNSIITECRHYKKRNNDNRPPLEIPGGDKIETGMSYEWRIQLQDPMFQEWLT